MRKVLHLRASGQLLGAERVVLELAKYLPKFSYQPVIGIPVEEGQPQPEFAAAAEALGYEVALFPIKGAFDMRALKTIRSFVADNNIELIHSHGYREDFYASFAPKKVKRLATNHLWKRTDLKLKFYAALDALLLKRFDKIIAVSKPVRDDMLKQGIGADKISVVANGIDVSSYKKAVDKNTIREQLNIPKDSTVLGTLSSLSIEKGINFAIQALAKIHKNNPNIHLLIVGDGPEKAPLQLLISQLKLENAVTFAGRRSDINNILAAIDIFLLPSLIEGLPMALLEAMAAEKAVIASTVGDVETVITADSGILVAPRNVDQLADAIEKLAADHSVIEHYGKNARSRISSHFSSLNMTQATAELYDQVLS